MSHLRPHQIWTQSPECPADRTICDQSLLHKMPSLQPHFNLEPNTKVSCRLRLLWSGSLAQDAPLALALNLEPITRISRTLCWRLSCIPKQVWSRAAVCTKIVDLQWGSGCHVSPSIKLMPRFIMLPCCQMSLLYLTGPNRTNLLYQCTAMHFVHSRDEVVGGLLPRGTSQQWHMSKLPQRTGFSDLRALMSKVMVSKPALT